MTPVLLEFVNDGNPLSGVIILPDTTGGQLLQIEKFVKKHSLPLSFRKSLR